MHNCTFKPIEESLDELGRRRHYCERCGLVTAPTKSASERIHAKCKAPRGAGDIAATFIEKGFRLIGLNKPNCGGCQERQRWLNKLLPFGSTQED